MGILKEEEEERKGRRRGEREREGSTESSFSWGYFENFKKKRNIKNIHSEKLKL